MITNSWSARRGKRPVGRIRQRRGANRQQHFGDGRIRGARAPLLQDKPGAKELLFDTGYRRSDYSTIGVANTYKFEVQYAPTADYRFRASYDRAIRAPSVAEAFTPPIVGTTTVGSDPCAPPITYSLQQCERTGVSMTQYNSGSIPQGTAAQLSEETSGNPHLKPEQADTYTFGVNFAPSRISHLTGSIDYHIQIKDRRHPTCWYCQCAAPAADVLQPGPCQPNPEA